MGVSQTFHSSWRIDNEWETATQWDIAQCVRGQTRTHAAMCMTPENILSESGQTRKATQCMTPFM